jgi:DNA polymerase (family 10)
MGKKNYEVAEILYKIADYLDLDEEEYKVRAYRRAARAIENLPEDIEDIAARNELEEIPGVGEAISKKIKEFLDTGKIKHLEDLKKKSPVDVESLNSLEGMGPKKIKILYQKLGVKTLKDLEKAARESKIRDLPGFGELSEKKILESVEASKLSKGRFPMSDVKPIAEKIKKILKSVDGVEEVEIVGSYRRKKKSVGDLDILVMSSSNKVMDVFVGMDNVDRVLGKGGTKASVVLKNGLQVDLRVVEKESYGAALVYFTGSKYHNIRLRKIAIKKGYKLNEYGLFEGEKMIAGRTEKEVYEKLGLKWIKPEERVD